MNARMLPTFAVLSLLAPTGCLDLAGLQPGAETGGAAEDEGDGTEAGGDGERGGEDGEDGGVSAEGEAYAVIGGMDYGPRARAMAAMGFQSLPRTVSQTCPFNGPDNPCFNSDCQQDPMSKACADAVAAYCAENQGDPGCQFGGDPGGEPGGDPGGEPGGDPGGETGGDPGGEPGKMEGCPFPPDSEPCTDPACKDGGPECGPIIDAYCKDHPEDPACHFEGGGEGGGEGGDPGTGEGGPYPGDGTGEGGHEGGEGGPDGGWVCDRNPEWPPCEACNTGDEQLCRDALHEHCGQNEEDPHCKEVFDDRLPEEAFTPDAMYLKVFKVEFSTNPDCSDAITVGESAEAEYQNFADAPQLVTGDAPPAGQYHCVIITMSDHIKWEVSEAGVCQGLYTQDVHSPEGGKDELPPVPNSTEQATAGGHGDGVESMLRVYMSTAGGDYSDPFKAPGMKLLAPQETGEDVLHSVFVTYAHEIVGYYIEEQNGETESYCDMGKPEFGFETIYK